MEHSFENESGELFKLHLTPQADGSYRADVGEQHYTVEVLARRVEGVLLRVNGQTQWVYTAQNGGQFFAGVGGAVFALQKSSPSAQRRTGSAHLGDLSASMPGQVIQVLAVAGAWVEKGQTLVLLEAMKMELRVKAPYAGRIKTVLCSTGQAVERGQLLVELEAEEN